MSSITWNMEMSLSACPVCTGASDNEQLPVTTVVASWCLKFLSSR